MKKPKRTLIAVDPKRHAWFLAMAPERRDALLDVLLSDYHARNRPDGPPVRSQFVGSPQRNLFEEDGDAG